MKRTIFISAAILAMMCSATAAGRAESPRGTNTAVTGPEPENLGAMVTEARRSNMEFDKIEISSLIHLIIEERTDGNIIVRAPEKIMPFVKISVADGVFTARTVDTKHKLWSTKLNDARVEIRIPNNGRIWSIVASGLSSVVANDVLQNDRFSLSLSGVSAADLNIDTERLLLDVTGASKASLAIRAKRAVMDISGASKVSLSLDCNSTSADITGASKASVTGDAGIGNIDVSGASKVALNCRGEMKVSVSGASKLQYGEECRLTVVDNSGLSSINKL